MSQRHVLGPTTLKEFHRALDDLVRVCVDFKLASPHVVAVADLDREVLRRAAEISMGGCDLAEVVARFARDVVPASLNFSAPTFLAHPDCGNATAGILGDVANSFLQQNLSSFDYSPAATVLEIELLHVLRSVVGFPVRTGTDSALATGGAVVFGGAGANFSCLLAAREHLKRQLRSHGRAFDPRRTRVLANRPFTHFSLRRGLHMLGLGNRDLGDAERQEAGLEAECLREVATSHFRTDAEDLERQIEATLARGEEIMCVFIVAGDSRFMAFDDIDRVADIAERYGLWVHVDACEGGQVLFSPRLRPLMRGVERAASISMDPHKVLMVPYNMSLFFLRDPDWLRYFSADPVTVINQDDTSLGGYTPGVNSKSFLSLKLLFMLQHWGWDRLAAEMDRRHELAVLAADWIADHPRLRLVNPDVTHNAVAFMYIPEGGPHDPATLNALNKALHQRLNMRTSYFVHGFPARDDEARIRSDKGTVYALRMMFGNPMSQSPEVVGCLEKIVKIGFELAGGSV